MQLVLYIVTPNGLLELAVAPPCDDEDEPCVPVIVDLPLAA
jgi:hypothetical protein